MSCIVKADLRCQYQTRPLEGAYTDCEQDLEAFFQLVKLICRPFPLELSVEKTEYVSQFDDRRMNIYQNHDYVIHIEGQIPTARFRQALYQTLDGLNIIAQPGSSCVLLIYDENENVYHES